MAVDTRDERAACLGFLLSFRTVLPNPDAEAEGQLDRQQISFTWPGIAVGGPDAGQPRAKYYAQIPHALGYGRLFQPQAVKG